MLNNDIFISEIKKVMSILQNNLETLNRLVYALKIDKDSKHLEEELAKLSAGVGK